MTEEAESSNQESPLIKLSEIMKKDYGLKLDHGDLELFAGLGLELPTEEDYRKYNQSLLDRFTQGLIWTSEPNLIFPGTSHQSTARTAH